MKVIKGNIIEAQSLNTLKTYKNGYLVLDEEGKLICLSQTLDKEYQNLPLTDYGDALILQSFCDMHLHAPQYPNIGLGMDLELIDWLNTYTFPTEAKCKDLNYARNIYSHLAKELINKGTTRVCMFSSLHTDATLVLMEELEKEGVTGYVGKVNMDRNGSSELEETTKESITETLRFIKEAERFKTLKPIITPRFTPSCTNSLMENLGKIANSYNLLVQSHLSENLKEIEWVKELHPDLDEYWQSYAKYNLWKEKTLMAHCVYSSDSEIKAMKEAKVVAVHCPDSNINICSGTAPIRHFLNEGVWVTLGSDIAGGSTLSMLKVMTLAIRASKNIAINTKDKSNVLTAEEAYYLATSSGERYFNDKVGFPLNEKLHAIVLDDTALVETERLTLSQRLERALYRTNENNIIAVYSEGRKVK